MDYFFEASGPLSNIFYIPFLANDKNPYPLIPFLVLGFVQYLLVSIY